MFAGTRRFKPLALIGRGSTGLVYRVRDEETGMEVALKTLENPSPDQLYRLKQEFRSLADIVHPNLVELYELVVDERESFFTMEYVEGVDFVRYLRAQGAAFSSNVGRNSERFLDSAAQLVRALSAVHAAGKLHRDVKPSNALITDAGRVVLLDFGLATALRIDPARDTASGSGAGTLGYMAPEQAWGQRPTPAADWYSVGVVLHEAITGRLPFEGPPAQLLADKARSAPPSLRSVVPGVPRELDDLVSELLAPNPTVRPEANDILKRLASCGEVDSASLAPQKPRTDSKPFVGRAPELEKLRSIFAQVRDGEARIAAIVGPSGIGKTEFVRRFLATLDDESQTIVLRGRCHPQELVRYNALDPIIDSLSRFLRSFPADVAASLTPRHWTSLIRLFPVLGRVESFSVAENRLEGAEEHEIRRRGSHALRELFGKIADRRPLILWIDDAQWGDQDSASLLHELLRPPDSPPMLVILSYRSEERWNAPIVERLRGDGGPLRVWSEEIELGPLTDEESRDLAQQLCEASFDQHVDSIASESVGSPFLISQLAHHLRTFGPDEREPPAGPVGLATMLTALVRRLPPATRQILEIVCLASRPIDRNLALDAAGSGGEGRAVFFHLERESLLRSTTVGEPSAVEAYHDRIRELIIEQLPPAVLAERHRQLFVALERLPAADPQELFVHCLGAGDRERARAHAIEAAARAAEVLAFDRAVRVYGQARELGHGTADSAAVRASLAEALANAGRSVEAGEAFESAAAELGHRSDDSDEIVRLHCRAGEQYLRSGRVEQGSLLLAQMLRTVGIRMPRTTAGAYLSSQVLRFRLLWRGIDFARRPVESISPEIRRRLDACWAAGLCLAIVDPWVADGLATRALLGALHAGDLSLVNRALAQEALKEASAGGPWWSRRADRLLEAVGRLTSESGTPQDEASYHCGIGAVAYYRAQWRKALEECDRAAAIWRDRCRGAHFEAETMKITSLAALAHLGALQELAARLAIELGDADTRGDIHGSTMMRVVPSILWLAEDRPDDVRDSADRAIAPWPTARFLGPHLFHLIATVQADLYVGDIWRAWRRVEETWPKFRGSGIQIVLLLRIEAFHLRARVALAAAARGQRARIDSDPSADPKWSPRRLLRVAEADARRIARHGLLTAGPFSAAISAAVAQLERRDSEALRLWVDAAEGFERAEMGLYRAAARIREGRLRGGDDGRRLEQAEVRWLREQGVQKPAALVDTLCPAG
jgi:serine/threonine protein kinase/tetratricopeptide (TPR) repeat protein